MFEQPTAGNRACGHADATDRTPDANRFGSFTTVGEHVGDDGQRRRKDRRSPDTHQRTRSDQRCGCADRPGVCRRCTEQCQADDQGSATPKTIAEAPSSQQQAGEHEQVRIHDPLQLTGGGAEFGGEARKGDVDD